MCEELLFGSCRFGAGADSLGAGPATGILFEHIEHRRPDRPQLSLLYRRHRRYTFPTRHQPREDAMSKGKEKRKPKADQSKKKGAGPRFSQGTPRRAARQSTHWRRQGAISADSRNGS